MKMIAIDDSLFENTEAGYAPFARLYKISDKNFFFARNVEEGLERIKQCEDSGEPFFVLCDGLDGNWIKIYTRLGNPKDFFLLTGERDVYDSATSLHEDQKAVRGDRDHFERIYEALDEFVGRNSPKNFEVK